MSGEVEPGEMFGCVWVTSPLDASWGPETVTKVELNLLRNQQMFVFVCMLHLHNVTWMTHADRDSKYPSNTS